jgi:hypothetical protein
MAAQSFVPYDPAFQPGMRVRTQTCFARFHPVIPRNLDSCRHRYQKFLFQDPFWDRNQGYRGSGGPQGTPVSVPGKQRALNRSAPVFV